MYEKNDSVISKFSNLTFLYFLKFTSHHFLTTCKPTPLRESSGRAVCNLAFPCFFGNRKSRSVTKFRQGTRYVVACNIGVSCDLPGKAIAIVALQVEGTIALCSDTLPVYTVLQSERSGKALRRPLNLHVHKTTCQKKCPQSLSPKNLHPNSTDKVEMHEYIHNLSLITLLLKVPSYSILGYDVWYKKDESVAAYDEVQLPRMSHTVHLILHLEPDTKYEVKARMYSNAGIGPFSEPQIVKTDVGKLSGLLLKYFPNNRNWSAMKI